MSPSYILAQVCNLTWAVFQGSVCDPVGQLPPLPPPSWSAGCWSPGLPQLRVSPACSLVPLYTTYYFFLQGPCYCSPDPYCTVQWAVGPGYPLVPFPYFLQRGATWPALVPICNLYGLRGWRTSLSFYLWPYFLLQVPTVLGQTWPLIHFYIHKLLQFFNCKTSCIKALCHKNRV